MKVDVILPVYKPTDWVFEAIDSVLQQTWPDWHLTVVDDCTPDPGEILSRLRSIAEKHPKITFVRLEENRRAAGARNCAIDLTDGDAIGFIDQDDRWHPEKLAQAVEFLDTYPEIMLVHSNIRAIDDDGKPLCGRFDVENETRKGIDYVGTLPPALGRMLFLRYTLRLGTIVVRRQAFVDVGGFDDTLFGGEDLEFAVRFGSRYRIGHLPKELAYRRLHDQNVGSTHWKDRVNGRLKALEKIAQAHPEWGAVARRKSAALLRTAVARAIRNGDRAFALACAKLLNELAPASPSTHLLWLFSVLGFYPQSLARMRRGVIMLFQFRQGRSARKKRDVDDVFRSC